MAESCNEYCSTCRFWNKNVAKLDDIKGKKIKVSNCRRYSPKVFDVQGNLVSVFPSTPSNEWCGEFEPTWSENEN